ncbi:Hypothetical predicted protein [Octopus vulgaris]|uniref:Uncharacterized protein n=1 Tax=Octopus vulgaris TaxID=6645 RepID=A0AA36F6D6_OCTVU|nr:Hypothetical predicted protein [Octopus vulgaris]
MFSSSSNSIIGKRKEFEPRSHQFAHSYLLSTAIVSLVAGPCYGAGPCRHRDKTLCLPVYGNRIISTFFHKRRSLNAKTGRKRTH